MAPKTKLRRFRPRFGLKALLGLMLLVSVVLASYRYLLEQQRKQREFMTLVAELGAKFTVTPLHRDRQREVTGPAEVRLLDRIVAVDLSARGWYPFENGAPLRTGNTEELAFESLIDLITSTVEVSNAWSVSLENARSSGTRNCIDRLPDLVGLKRLSLRGLRLSDQDLAVVGRLSQLEHLNLRATRLTDAGLQHVGNLSRLRHLMLGYTKISDTGLEHLRGLSRLQTLDLTNTEVSDAGLDVLCDLTDLRYVYLGDTLVTHLDLSHLPKLEYVDAIGAPLVHAKVADGVRLMQGGRHTKDLFAKSFKSSSDGL